ncbi:MAG: rhomboid family intramembrane serine protease [Thermoprotei archaeon]|nr:MAG: rhomboid family intramembrane serine protease [Thermoprotei archaeon]
MTIPVGDTLRVRKVPVVTWFLIFLNVLVFIYMMSGGTKFFYSIVMKYGMIPAYIVRGERLYTLITSMFIHGGLLHLVGNMVYLYIFGDNVEAKMGRATYLLFYILSGIAAAFMHIFVVYNFARPIAVPFTRAADPRYIPCVGASGAISGILGAYFVLYPLAGVRVLTFYFFFPVVITVPAYVFLGLWFIYQLLMGTLSIAYGYFSGVAFWAHIGGFLFGMIAALPFRFRRRRLRRYVIYYPRYYDVPVY